MTNRRRALSLALLLLFTANGLRAETLNGVILRINDQIATLYDYQQRRQEAVREISARVQDPAERRELLAQAPEIVFRDLYEQLLLDSRADQLGIFISDKEVDETIAGMRADYGIETDEQFARALQQAGMSLPLLREQMRRNLRLQAVRGREIRPRVQVDEEDLRRYYRKNEEQFRLPEQVQVREVVVRDGSEPNAQKVLAPEERLRIAEAIRSEVTAGKPLADAVAPYVQTGVATNVVEFGWVARGDLDPTLEAVAWDLQAGQVSAPVEGRGGLHVLQVTERRPSRIAEFSEVAEQIREREQNRVYREEVAKYMQELEQKALIVANPPQEAAGFRRLLGGSPETDTMGNEVDPMSTAAPASGATAEEAVESAVSEAPRPQDRDTGQNAPQAPGTLPEPKPITDAPPATPPPGA
ncbi:MAG TPA: peptidyl-prolyl cis-trans isomerase [Thermoanaerobaculia bacterium]|nr:peptidyl-prolyl cis-trans isomerase [Thermoanaerobaculia bacterium]